MAEHNRQRWHRNRLVAFLIGAIVLGCAIIVGSARLWHSVVPATWAAFTPEAAVRQVLISDGTPPPGFQVLRQVALPGSPPRHLVFYTLPRTTAAVPPSHTREIGVFTVERGLLTWKPTAGSGVLADPAADHVLDYGHASQQAGTSAVAEIYGMVYAPEVRIVEATFDNGQIVRATMEQDLFVLVAPGATSGRELRALNAQGQVIQRYALHPTAPSPR